MRPGLTGIIRALTRAAGLAMWTALCLLLLFGGLARERWQRRLQRLWFRGVVRLLGARLILDGATPTTPGLVVCNHVSYVDVAILGATLDATFVARADLSQWPVVGFLSRLVGTLYVNREQRRDSVRAVAVIRATIERGRTVVLFPEGVATDGTAVAPFRSSLLEAAASAGAPVTAAALSYATAAGWPEARSVVAWWDDTSLWRHLARLLAVPRFEARLAFDPDPVAHDDRKILTDVLREKVASLHGLLRGPC